MCVCVFLGDLSSTSERFFHPPKVHDDDDDDDVVIMWNESLILYIFPDDALEPDSLLHVDDFQPFTKVVVAKYPMGSMAVADMLALGKPFGTIVKHLIFPFKVITREEIILDSKEIQHVSCHCVKNLLFFLFTSLFISCFLCSRDFWSSALMRKRRTW